MPTSWVAKPKLRARDGRRTLKTEVKRVKCNYLQSWKTFQLVTDAKLLFKKIILKHYLKEIQDQILEQVHFGFFCPR